MDGKTKMATDVKTLPYAALLSPEAIEAGAGKISRDSWQDCLDEARAVIEAAIAEARRATRDV
jgi:hypothetical protein